MTPAARRAPADIALYRQIDSILREQIADGVLRPGDRLPPEEALRTEYGISRGTIRQALDALERDGLIERTPGRGTFVRAGQRSQPQERPWVAWPAMVRDMPRRARQLVREGIAPPPLVVARVLGLAPDVATPFFIRTSAEAPAGRLGVKRYLHPDFTAETALLAAVPNFDRALAGFGALSRGPCWAEALLAEPRFAMLLDLPFGAPLLSLWWVDRLDGRAAACTQMLQTGAAIALLLADDGDADAL